MAVNKAPSSGYTLKKNMVFVLQPSVDFHANEALENGYYIEAIQYLHGCIEGYMQMLFLLVGSRGETINEYKKCWDTANELNYSQLARILFVLNIIPQSFLDKLLSFNRIRNEIIHRIFVEPYDGARGISLDRINKEVKEGIELQNNLAELSDAVVSDEYLKKLAEKQKDNGEKR